MKKTIKITIKGTDKGFTFFDQRHYVAGQIKEADKGQYNTLIIGQRGRAFGTLAESVEYVGDELTKQIEAKGYKVEFTNL